MDDVVENGPAWESGVRKGDVIVTVNDWLIVLMDRPQVGNLSRYSNFLFFEIVLVHSCFCVFLQFSIHSLITFNRSFQHLGFANR